MDVSRRALGTKYEEIAWEHVRARGAEPVAFNFRCRSGEVDLIYREGGYLVFAEVKYRESRRFGSALEAVGPSKQRRICRVAAYYLECRGLGSDTPVRFDVLALEGEGAEGPVAVQWIRDAFPWRGR